MFYQLQSKSLSEHGVSNYKELWENIKDTHEGMRLGVLTAFEKREDDDKKRYGVVLSTDDVDRHGDVVKQSWSLKNFKQNPVVVDSHHYDSIFRILGKMHKVGVRDGKLRGEIEFTTSTVEGFMAEAMVDEGFVRAGSVGFIPLDFDESGNITKSELLEFSLVAVPANPNALFDKVKQYGNTDDEGNSGSAPAEDSNSNKGADIQEAGEPSEEVEEQETGGNEEDEKSQENGIIETKEHPIKKWARKENQRRRALFKESLAVIRRLEEKEYDSDNRKQMVNRAIRQLLKAK